MRENRILNLSQVIRPTQSRHHTLISKCAPTSHRHIITRASLLTETVSTPATDEREGEEHIQIAGMDGIVI